MAHRVITVCDLCSAEDVPGMMAIQIGANPEVIVDLCPQCLLGEFRLLISYCTPEFQQSYIQNLGERILRASGAPE